MNELKLIQKNNQHFIDSRDAAINLDKEHSNLLRDIEGYINTIKDSQNSTLNSDEFFIEDTYQAGTGKKYKMYWLTKKGCEMVANKMIGTKGILFTAMYVNIFNEMEKKQNIDNEIASCLLSIYNGGANAIEASKKLTEIEMKPLKLNSPIKADDEAKSKEVAELLKYYTVRKNKPYSQFIGAVIKQLDNKDNRIYRHTFSHIFNKKEPNEIIYIKREAIPEILDYINNLSFTIDNNIRTYTINNKNFYVVKK